MPLSAPAWPTELQWAVAGIVLVLAVACGVYGLRVALERAQRRADEQTEREARFLAAQTLIADLRQQHVLTEEAYQRQVAQLEADKQRWERVINHERLLMDAARDYGADRP